MSTYLVKTGRIEEHPVEGKPLGRHIYHDSRSLAYPYQGGALQTVTWARAIGILDQGNLGSCTGNAMVGAAATDPVYGGLPVGHVNLNEEGAITLYGAATRLDSYPGAYPPDDTGSDGLSVCKAAQNLGLISGYTHCFDLNTALQALSAGPVLFGINWYDSFDNPDSSGLVAISSNASIRGGHEIVARGIDTTALMIYLDNSWGVSWGKAGSFSMSFGTMERLLSESGDATVPVPATLPAPVPVPVPPTPPVPDIATPADVTLAHALGQWPYARHYGAAKTAAANIVTWEHAKNLGPG